MPRPSRKIAIRLAAARLFAAKGYHAASVRDIAAEMELIPASLYYYLFCSGFPQRKAPESSCFGRSGYLPADELARPAPSQAAPHRPL